ILGNIRLGAAVLDADLDVRVWNERAAELWGVRSDEVLGESFFDLDIGLPVKELRPMIRSVLRGKPSHDEKIVAAITRRGKRIRCRVAATALAARGRAGGVVLVMEDQKPVLVGAGSGHRGHGRTSATPPLGDEAFENLDLGRELELVPRLQAAD